MKKTISSKQVEYEYTFTELMNMLGIPDGEFINLSCDQVKEIIIIIQIEKEL